LLELSLTKKTHIMWLTVKAIKFKKVQKTVFRCHSFGWEIG